MATCVHHWLIEEPKGEYSKGTCRNCGIIRTFRNWVSDFATWSERQDPIV